MGDDAEARHVAQFYAKLCLVKQDSLPDISENNTIAFKNGLLNLGSLLDFSKSTIGIEGIDLQKLPFTPYREMRRTDLRKLGIRCTINANFDPSLRIDKFQAYLNSTFGSDDSLASVLQEMSGYCLIYQYPFHVWALLLGPGGNGKGTYLHVLRELLGKENVSELNFASMHRFSGTYLQHKLANITDEMPKSGANWDLLKNLTGGGTTQAEVKCGPVYSFKTTAKHIIVSNDLPVIADTTPGFWDRFILIPFMNKFRMEAGEILNYEVQLIAEIDAIATWAVAGLVRLLKRRHFELPDTCRTAKSQARTESDSVRSFVEERCVLDDRCAEYSQALYRAYESYCIASNLRPKSPKNFTQSLNLLGVSKARDPSTASHRPQVYRGIGYIYQTGRWDLIRSRAHVSEMSQFDSVPLKYCRRPHDLIDDKNLCAACEHQCPASNSGEKARLRPQSTNKRIGWLHDVAFAGQSSWET